MVRYKKRIVAKIDSNGNIRNEKIKYASSKFYLDFDILEMNINYDTDKIRLNSCLEITYSDVTLETLFESNAPKKISEYGMTIDENKFKEQLGNYTILRIKEKYPQYITERQFESTANDILKRKLRQYGFRGIDIFYKSIDIVNIDLKENESSASLEPSKIIEDVIKEEASYDSSLLITDSKDLNYSSIYNQKKEEFRKILLNYIGDIEC